MEFSLYHIIYKDRFIAVHVFFRRMLHNSVSNSPFPFVQRLWITEPEWHCWWSHPVRGQRKTSHASPLLPTKEGTVSQLVLNEWKNWRFIQPSLRTGLIFHDYSDEVPQIGVLTQMTVFPCRIAGCKQNPGVVSKSASDTQIQTANRHLYLIACLWYLF